MQHIIVKKRLSGPEARKLETTVAVVGKSYAAAAPDSTASGSVQTDVTWLNSCGIRLKANKKGYEKASQQVISDVLGFCESFKRSLCLEARPSKPVKVQQRNSCAGLFKKKKKRVRTAINNHYDCLDGEMEVLSQDVCEWIRPSSKIKLIPILLPDDK